MDSVTRIQILYEDICVSFWSNAFGKDRNLCSLTTNQTQENKEFKIALLRLKINLTLLGTEGLSVYIYIYIYIYIPGSTDSRKLTPPPPLSLSLSPTISSIAPGRSSRLHPVSAQSWCMLVLVCRPIKAHTCVGIHKRTSLMSLTSSFIYMNKQILKNVLQTKKKSAQMLAIWVDLVWFGFMA